MVKFAQFCATMSLLLSVVAAIPPYYCSCGLGPGEEMCRSWKKNKPCAPLVVRPVELPKLQSCTTSTVCNPLPNLPPLVPVGGPCSCQQAIVTPAVVPRPACTACCAKSVKLDSEMCQKLTLEQQQQLLFGGGCNDKIILSNGANRPVLTTDELIIAEGNPALLAPADAVSLSLAYNAATQKCLKSEGDLSFGFKTIPKEVPTFIKRVINVPEERLYKINGQPVELKLKEISCSKSIDEEAAEDLLEAAVEEAEEALAESRNVKKLTLGEIGYGPSKVIPAPMINLPALPAPAVESNVECIKGFVPGNVVIQTVPSIEPIVDTPISYPAPCGGPSSLDYSSLDKSPKDASQFPIPCGCESCKNGAYPYYMTSSYSSSASSSNCEKKSHFSFL